MDWDRRVRCPGTARWTGRSTKPRSPGVWISAAGSWRSFPAAPPTTTWRTPPGPVSEPHLLVPCDWSCVQLCVGLKSAGGRLQGVLQKVRSWIPGTGWMENRWAGVLTTTAPPLNNAQSTEKPWSARIPHLYETYTMCAGALEPR